MRLSTMTSLFRDRRGCSEHYSYSESIRRCHDAGFSVLDMSFCALTRRQTPLHLDNWEEQIDQIRNLAENLGCEFSQSHPPYIPSPYARFSTQEDEDFFYQMELRSIRMSAMLGVKWAVLHPVTDPVADISDIDAHIRYNFQKFGDVLQLADKENVGIAFENMFDLPAQPRRFGVSATELSALQDAARSNKVGICWDTGHANKTYSDQIPAIMSLGDRIKALHIDDNYGKDDLHMLPFEGFIPWEKVMHAFYVSHCDADLTLETVTNRCMPDELADWTAKYSYEVGRHLLSLYR